MDLPKRKQMRFKEYDYSQNNAYYITICTHNRAHLFGEIVGAHLCVRPNAPDKLIEKWLFQLENKYLNLRMDQFVIMLDHIHFILFNPGAIDTETGAHIGAPLPEIVKWYKSQTTNDYIKGVRNGLFPPFDRHIWQRNYYEHIIRNQDDYHQIWHYIQQNPIRWEEDVVQKSH